MVNWYDHASPPQSKAIKLGDDLYVTWPSDEPSPLLWHWCTRSVWIENNEVDREFCRPSWVPTGVQRHTLVSRDPLHLEPSVFWPGCCGMHGHVREGKWVSV